MAVEQLPGKCWVLDQRDPRDGGEPHYKTKAAAMLGEDGPDEKLTARQLPGGCWIVTCDGECGDRPEDDEYGQNIHCADRAEAERFAESCGWIVTRDGAVFCPDDAPDCATADLAVIEQIPGQLTLDPQEAADA